MQSRHVELKNKLILKIIQIIEYKMTHSIGMLDLHFLIKNPKVKVKVNDKEYACIEGLETEGGFYRNGWTVEAVKNKKKYIRFEMYTSCGQSIQVEEKWLIDLDGKVIARKGWNNIDLLRYSQPGECKRDMNTIVKRFK